MRRVSAHASLASCWQMKSLHDFRFAISSVLLAWRSVLKGNSRTVVNFFKVIEISEHYGVVAMWLFCQKSLDPSTRFIQVHNSA